MRAIRSKPFLTGVFLPIINENDTVVVEEIRFGDNDHLSAMIAGLIGADLVIILTDTAGVVRLRSPVP